jgi:enoyl-[acyl-carrier protein] reductase I
VWVPALKIFETSFKRGKFDESRKLSDGSLMDFTHIYPMDAVFDSPEDVPEDIATNKRYAGNDGWTVTEVAERVAKDIGKIDIVVHSLANGPEVTKPLLETSRRGYLAAMSASSYSLVSMVQRFGPNMNPGGAVVSLTYLASERIIPSLTPRCSRMRPGASSTCASTPSPPGRWVPGPPRPSGSSMT